MPFFKNTNSSKASVATTSSTAPLNPKVPNVFDSSSPSSPLFSPYYQVPVHSVADSVAILRAAAPDQTKNTTKREDTVDTVVSAKPDASA